MLGTVMDLEIRNAAGQSFVALLCRFGVNVETRGRGMLTRWRFQQALAVRMVAHLCWESLPQHGINGTDRQLRLWDRK